jgi:S-DNA-T family DNA segregation ATPase FtsK/SpoIIIE
MKTVWKMILRPVLSAGNEGSFGGDGEKDELFDQARDLFIRSQKASTTSLQTAFGIGYPRAARLMHILEEEGVVGMVDGKNKYSSVATW